MRLTRRGLLRAGTLSSIALAASVYAPPRVASAAVNRRAVASRLGPSVEKLMSGATRLMVTGHGGLVSTDEMGPYAELIESVEAAAVDAREAGLTVAEAAERYQLPRATADWGFFNPRYPERAIAAWFREWERDALQAVARA